MTGRPSGRNWNPESLICWLSTRGAKSSVKKGGACSPGERLVDLWTSLGERTENGGGECRLRQCRAILTFVMDDSADKSDIVFLL